MKLLGALLATLLLVGTVAAFSNFDFDFIDDSEEDCDPVGRLLQDPRASGLRELLEQDDLVDSYRKAWNVSGGTVVVPTTEAFDSFLGSVGAGWDNVSEVVSIKAWDSIIPSWFMANVTYLPKDVYNVVYQTPSGFFVLMAPFVSTETDGTDEEGAKPKVSLIVHYVDVDVATYLPGRGSVANLTAIGTPGRVVDFSTVCSMYTVYWLDTVAHPFRDACALTFGGCEDPDLQKIVDSVGGLLTPAPGPRESADEDSNNRRLLL